MIDFEIVYDDETTTPQQTAEFSLEYDDNQPDFSKVKANEIFSTDGSNTDAPMKLQKVNKSWMDKFLNSDMAKFGDTQTKATVRGLYEIGGGIGSMISWYGDNMILPKGSFGLDDKTIDRINTFGKGWQKFGETLKKGSDFVLNSEGLKLDKEIFSGDIIDNPSLTRVSAAVMSAVPSLMSMVSMTKATGSTALSYFVMGGVDSADVYNKSKEKGQDLEKTNLLYTSSMAGTALIDKLFSPVEKILGGKTSTIWKKLSNRIVSGLAEGGAESGQTFWQNAVTKYGIDPSQNLIEGFFESMIGGFGSGAVASGMFNNASQTIKDNGASQQEIDGVLNEAAEYVQKNADDINNIVYQHFEEGMANFDKFIEENKDEAAVAQALAKKKELEQIYNDSYNELVKIVPEEQAKSNAALIRNSAFFFSEAFGISPKEYVARRGVKVQKSDRTQFMNKPSATEVEGEPLMQVTQKEINYAKAHPEWKSNARIIEMIGQAGADINDSLDNINKALKEYSIKEYKHAKEMEIAEFDRRARELSEDLQERYAMMVENGVSPQDAYNAVTYTEDYIPFQTGESKALSINISRDDYINPNQNYELPRLNKLDLEKLGKEDKPVILKKNIIQKNKNNHPEVSIDEYNDILTDTLINTTEILQVQPNKKPNYYTFVNVNKNDVSVVELSDNKDSYEVVNFFKINTKRLEEYRNKTAKDGGDIIITERKTQGAARLSALQSYDDIVSPNRENVNRTFYQESLSIAVENAELDKVNPAYEGEMIDIDGVERTVYNSNGDRIAMSEPALRNFYKWFGDSKVVDEQGRPWVVAHSTDAVFDVFDINKAGESGDAGWLGTGFYFFGDRSLDNQYGKYVMPVYLKIENPYYASYEEKSELADMNDKTASDDFRDKLIDEGYDGVYYNADLNQEWVAFEPNQIKSTSNRGTYDPNDDRIYYQGGEERNLVAVHSISAGSLEKAIGFGGFPVPSIAIINKNQEFHFDGQPITLVGNKEMIDPYDERNEVYNRDIWSKTFPLKTYKTPTVAKEKKFKEKIGEYFKKTVSENSLGSFLYTAQRGNPTSALSEFMNSSGAIMYYLENVKKEHVELPKKDKSSDYIFNMDEQLASEIKDLDASENKEEISEAVKRMIDREVERKKQKLDPNNKLHKKMLEVYKETRLERDFDNNGLIYFGVADSLVNNARKYYQFKGKEVLDHYDVNNFLREKIKDDSSYEDWAIKFFEDELVGEPMVEIGNKLKPFTLDNVVEAMISGATVATQESVFFASGKIIASGAKKLESISDIREEGKKLVTKEQSQKNMDEINEQINTFTQNFMDTDDFSHNMSRKEASGEAIAQIVKNKTITKESLRKALNKHLVEKNSYPDDVLSYGVTLANNIKEMSRYYFEAKPQRAVGLTEFSGAIIPTDPEFDAIAKKVQDNGLKVVRSDDQVEAMKQFEGAFFQDSTNGAKGAYVNRIIHLFENVDASTIPHELAHYWKDMLKDAAQMSKKAQKMLEDVEKWANQEFDRKYSVQQKDGKFVVNNKQGLTVYDHNFRTAEDAKSYAQEELFAQGFEMYLKEGKAPNNSLKQAFRNFLMWLKHIYKQAMQLDIRLSPDMRNVYADILGGADIDFFLNTDPDTFIENRIRLAGETENSLDDQIAEAQRMGVNVSDPDGRKLKDVWEKAMIPLSTRLGRISNELKNRLRRYEFNITNSLNKYYDEARPFLQKWKNFSEMDAIAFDIALKNDYVKKQLEIVDKYGAREEWEKVRKLLLDIYDSAIKAGLDVNFRPDYFPHKVKDAKGLLAYLRGTEQWTKFQEALREADPENVFTEEEQADFINKYLRGFVKVDMMPYKYSSEKQRKIERINNEMNKYYAPSMESLVSYIEGMNARIKASEFLGRDAEKLEESVGGYLTYLLDNNKIDPTKVDEVREILQARFAQKGVGNRFVAGMRDLSYMYTMGGINSAITQIEDLSVSMYKAGIWNTLTTAFENKKIKRADLGLDKISAEFVENPSKTARGVEKLFKLTGLDKIDSFGKETLVNAMVKKFQKMSEKSLKEYLEPIMEQDTNQTIQDIKNGELSDNVLYLVFSELSDVQPISLSELPAFYNTSGNLRVLYMLKSFMVKRIDIFRNECFDKLRSGNKEARIQGMQNLFRLAILMIFCGASKDLIINMLYGRDIDLPEMLINNALGLVGFSKFHAYQLRDKGAGEVIKDFLMPPMFAPYDDLLGDVVRIGRGKRDLKDAETLKGIPLVGRFYYWHIGRGKEKMNKRKNKLK